MGRGRLLCGREYGERDAEQSEKEDRAGSGESGLYSECVRSGIYVWRVRFFIRNGRERQTNRGQHSFFTIISANAIIEKNKRKEEHHELRMHIRQTVYSEKEFVCEEETYT